ncbi:uncharacterized protein LOC125660740 [Ostrea edulis]|uniref:uncharacterized protein LOC125660740 n=1 Tax=Ostrea edulis TaxID=37623 RepID=UPI0024AF1A54|nr:uncharacterized protein LOC125660740 [Ostrea edulis]
MIDSFVNFSILDCAEECLRTTRCKSVSYYKGTNYCEINYDNKSSVTDRFLESSGWIYSDKDDWDTGIISSCSASKCSIDEKCKPLPRGNFECVLSECRDGWIPFQDHWYTPHNNRQNQESAKMECGKENAYLVEINSSEENSWIKDTFLTQFGKILGIHLHIQSNVVISNPIASKEKDEDICRFEILR